MQAMFGNEGTKISVWPAIYSRLIRKTIAALCFLAANHYTRRLIASINHCLTTFLAKKRLQRQIGVGSLVSSQERRAVVP